MRLAPWLTQNFRRFSNKKPLHWIPAWIWCESSIPWRKLWNPRQFFPLHSPSFRLVPRLPVLRSRLCSSWLSLRRLASSPPTHWWPGSTLEHNRIAFVTKGAVTLCNLLSNLQRNIEKCFCCSCRGGVLHRATQSEQLGTICTEKALRRSRWSVGFTKKSTHARGKLRCKLLEGCYTVQRQLQVATIVAKSRTGFYFVQRCVQQKKMRCKLPRYSVTPRNSSASKNCAV